MSRKSRSLGPIALAWMILFAASEARAQTSYPMLSRVSPTAVRRGQSAEITIGGVHEFESATAILFEGKGLSAEILPAEKSSTESPSKKGKRRNGSTVRARVSADAEAALGPRELRVVTPSGVSSVGLIVVVADPVVPEADDAANDAPAQAQAVPVPSAVTGTIGKAEDVDWYALRAEAGQTLAMSVWGNRLEDKIHDMQSHFDPILVLHDATGRELAVDDNGAFADPLLFHTFRESGTYLLEIRDTTYSGNAGWTYVLSLTSGPVATSVFPLAVRPGSRAELSAKGVNFGAGKAVDVDIPPETASGPFSLSLAFSGEKTPPVSLVATSLPIVKEANDAPEAGGDASLSIPSALAGRLETSNDVDGYRFEAKKGTAYSFEVYARRVGSAADPVVRVVNTQGATLAEADDSPGLGKDCRLDWTAPTDGPVSIQINDLHSRGGDGFGYVILAEEAKPDFVAFCDPDKVNIGPGARSSIFVRLERRNGFQGAVTLAWEGLPAGVSASPLTIAPAMTQGEIVLSAAPDAKEGAALVSLSARGEHVRETLVRRVRPKQEIYMPGGGRAVYPVETLAVGVTRPSDITVEASPGTIVLKPGQTAAIDVTIRRNEGFDKPVNLAIALEHLGQVYANPLPPGVVVKSAGSKTLIGPSETSGKILLEARPDAKPSEPVPFAVMGHISINFVVKTAYCSAPITVRVDAP